MAARVLDGVIGATSTPVGLYVEPGVRPSFVYRLHPITKQVWALALVLVPAFFPQHGSLGEPWGVLPFPRIIAMGSVLLATAVSLPPRLYVPQLRRLLLLSMLAFFAVAFVSDAVSPNVYVPFAPPDGVPLASLGASPSTIASPDGDNAPFCYVMLEAGIVKVTRKSLKLAISAASIALTVLLASNLCLTTTTPEASASALRGVLAPVRRILPWRPARQFVDDVCLGLLLALRFIALVFEEANALALGLATKDVPWRSLGPMRAIGVGAGVLGKLVRNLLGHAEKIAVAMHDRGFRGASTFHAYTPGGAKDLRWGVGDAVALAVLAGAVYLATYARSHALV